MSLDELAVMDGGKCILQVRGVRPFLSDKFDITKHKNYKLLSDANPKNAFDIERFVSTRLKVKPEEEYPVFNYVEPDEECPQKHMEPSRQKMKKRRNFLIIKTWNLIIHTNNEPFFPIRRGRLFVFINKN